MSTKSPVGYYRTVLVPTPAVGAEFVMTSPGQGTWVVLSLAWVLATAVGGSDRTVTLIADDQTDVWFRSLSGVSQAGAVTANYGAFPGVFSGGFATSLVNIALPSEGLVLLPGNRLRSSTPNLAAGDQFSAIRAQVREYPMGPEFEWLPTSTVQVELMG